jgi:K+-transporting ATPase KdpF subunit
MSFDFILGLLVTAFVLVYLTYALLKPEKLLCTTSNEYPSGSNTSAA